MAASKIHPILKYIRRILKRKQKRNRLQRNEILTLYIINVPGGRR